MKRLMLVLTMLFAFLFTFTADVMAYDGFVGSKGNRHWKKAIKKNKPVFLYFCTKNCAACKNFDPTYKRIKKEYKKKYQFIKVDGEIYNSAKLLRQFNVQYFPNLIAVNPATLNYKRIETRDYNLVKDNLENFLRCCNTYPASSCPTCQTCPTNPTCLECPTGAACPCGPTCVCPQGKVCPTGPSCVGCPQCKVCPTVKKCPTCPTINPQTCPTCR